MKPSDCPRCAFRLPEEARFCPQCGKPVVIDETTELPVDPALERARAERAELPGQLGAKPTASMHRTERRPLGVAPVPLLAGLTLLALLLAIVLSAAVGWIPGIGLLMVTALLCALLVTGVRHQPESATAQTLTGLIVRVRGLTAFGLAAARTWGRTGLQVLSLRWRRLGLERDLRRRLTPLGEAVHESDSARAETLKAEAAELQSQLDEASRRESEVLTVAQTELRRERAPVQPTEVFRPVGSRSADRSGSSGEQLAGLDDHQRVAVGVPEPEHRRHRTPHA